jgi:hypothetical protein
MFYISLTILFDQRGIKIRLLYDECAICHQHFHYVDDEKYIKFIGPRIGQATKKKNYASESDNVFINIQGKKGWADRPSIHFRIHITIQIMRKLI